MISPTTLMCHFEFYGYSNLASQSRPPFLPRFSEQALSPVPPNTCMGPALYATGDRTQDRHEVLSWLDLCVSTCAQATHLTLRLQDKLGPHKPFRMTCRLKLIQLNRTPTRSNLVTSTRYPSLNTFFTKQTSLR